MGYALKDLRFNPGVGPSGRLRYDNQVPCAYCRGLGEDPKYVGPAVCPVCAGAREIKTTPPVVTCLTCSGSGRTAGDLICLSCRGQGVVAVRPEASICHSCLGTGAEGRFSCNACKGQGIV
jgi:DnaJ-class molecular chaperone